jgi:Asp/Glu/hydantoin racemase
MNDKTQFRIWFQGATDRVQHSAYISKLEPHLKAVADPEFAVEFHTVTPPATTTHAITEFRIARAIIRNVVEAERRGYDAVAITHFQDAGLHEAKSLVDIPVLGLGETTLFHACTLGRKLGLVTINPQFVPWHEDQVIRYGLQQRVVGVRAVDARVSDFMHAFAAEEGYRALYPKWEREVRVLPMLLFGAQHGAAVDGAPIVNGLTVLAKAAETAIKLRRLAGLSVSRRSNYAKPPPQALNEFLDQG